MSLTVSDGSVVPDLTHALLSELARLAQQPRSTLHLPDGVHGLTQPLVLPAHVSLKLTPAAVLRALPGFSGRALVIKQGSASKSHRCDGVIQGGTLDAGGLPITGILVEDSCRLLISEMEIQNATHKGIHIGVAGWYECNVAHVRISLDENVRAQPGSIGLHYDRCTDSLINSVVVIGYETGARSDSSSNDFHQVHVWNMPGNGPLKYCFYCNGWNDSYNQCYADSPFAGDEVCYGFFVTRPFNRIIAGRVYCNDFVPDNRAVGVHLDPGGTHGTFLANHFTARDCHRIAAGFSGNFDSACIVGNSFGPNVVTGRVCQIPSGQGGLSAMPMLTIAGTGEMITTGTPAKESQ